MTTAAPHAAPPQELVSLLRAGPALVLSGAGISTESGIPDYRGPDARPRAPMTYATFRGSEAARRRYWARSFLGWPIAARARPNQGHRALVRLERTGRLVGVVTQNVDGLHQEAGSRSVLELHGSLATVRCLECGAREGRASSQERLRRANPDFAARATDVAPDGDVEIPASWTERFRVVPCLRCGGVLKPDVVFFGENVPRDRVERAYGMLHEATSLLVLGSSLTVFSGYRFVRRARERGIPVVVVNDGPTRADGDASLRYDARLGPFLAALATRLLDDATSAGTAETSGGEESAQGRHPQQGPSLDGAVP